MNNLQLPKAPEIKFFQSAEYARRIEKAKFRLRAKPFIERFKIMNTLAVIGTFFFPAISILTAIAFLYGYIKGAIGNIYISIVIAFIVLTLLELTKNHLLNNGLDTYFSNSGKSTLTFIFALLFSIGSFFMSYQGAELLVKNLDSSKQQIVDNIKEELSAIEKKYNNLIIAEQSKITDLKEKAKRQWKGLNTPEQNKLLIQYEGNLKYFRQQANNEKQELSINKIDRLEKAETTVLYNAYIFKIFAAINELLTILSILFTAFYAFKTVREDMDLNDFRNQPEKYNTAEPTFKTPVEIEPQITKQSLNKAGERNVVTGFLKTKVNSQRSPLNDERSNKRKCKNCGNEFEYKHWNKKYCSDECRITFWEQKTGTKLKLKKSKQ